MHQQHNARQHQRVFAQAFEKDLGPDQRFDAFAPRLAVKLDGPEQIVQIGEGQRGLAVLGRHFDDLIDAVGAVYDGKFGMEAEMDKHCLHCKNSGEGVAAHQCTILCNRSTTPLK